MKIGLSIYSLIGALRAGEMTVTDAIRWIADNGGEHLEIVDFIKLGGDDGLLEAIVEKADACGVEISAYCIFANVLAGSQDDCDREIERVYGEIELARRLGARMMRSDLAEWGRPPETNVIEQFEADLPRMVYACRKIADYAKRYGITVTLENHGTYINGGDRVRRLITAVDRDNYRCTLDVGNALCVDVDPMVCVKTLLPFAATIHFKDFYIRRDDVVVDEGRWLTTNFGTHLRGAIVGHGDVDTVGLMKLIKESGYGGTVAIEFEGMEDCRVGSKLGMDNVRRYAQLD